MNILDKYLIRFWNIARFWIMMLFWLAFVIGLCWCFYQVFLAIVGDVAHVIKNA